MFYYQLMRDALQARFKQRFFEPDFMKLCFQLSTILHSESLTPGHITSSLLDNLYGSIWLYEPETYLQFVANNGLQVVASSKLGPQYDGVHFADYHSACRQCVLAKSKQKPYKA